MVNFHAMMYPEKERTLNVYTCSIVAIKKLALLSKQKTNTFEEFISDMIRQSFCTLYLLRVPFGCCDENQLMVAWFNF